MVRKERKPTKEGKSVLPSMPRKYSETMEYEKKGSVYYNKETAMEALQEQYPDIPQAVLHRAWSIWYCAELDLAKKKILEEAIQACPKSLNTMDQWKDVQTEYPDCISITNVTETESSYCDNSVIVGDE